MRYRGLFLCLLFFLLPFFSAHADVTCSAYKGQKSICVSESVNLQKGKCTVRPVSNAAQESLCKTAPTFENCGTVRVITPTGPCATVSKCSRNFAKEIQACLQKIALESGDVIDLTPEDQGEGSEEPLLPSMQAVLDGAFDFEEERDAAVAALTDDGISKESAEQIIDKLAADDVIGAKAVYDRELTLNPDLAEKARLNPNQQAAARTRAEARDPYAPDTTFGDNKNKSGGCDLDKAQQVIKYLESGGRYGISTPAGGGRVVHGAYQMLTDNAVRWSCEIGQCANAAQFLRNPGLQDQVFRHKFEQYKRARGSYTTAAGMWHGGPGFNVNRSDVLGTKTGSYMARFARLCGDSSFSFDKNDYTLYGGDPYYGSLTGQNSPFANTNPFAAPSQPRAQQYPQQQAPRPPITPVWQQILPQGLQGTPSTGGTLPPAPTLPEASIIVQPKEVSRGNPLTIVWSSVGVSTLEPCRVSLESGGSTSQIARANNGSRTIFTSATSTPGTWRFSLQCSISGGRLLERSASALVK